MNLFVMAYLLRVAGAEEVSIGSARTLYQQAMSTENIVEQQKIAAESLDIYKTVLLEEKESSWISHPHVWVDMGNVALIGKDIGYASFAYHKATQLDPSLPSAAQNLRWIEKQYLVEWSVTKKNSMWNTVFFWKGWLPTVGSIALSSLMFAIALFVPKRLVLWRQIAVVCWLVLWIGVVVDLFAPQKCVVITDNAMLRSADQVSAPLVHTKALPPGISMEILQQQDIWTQVQLPSGEKGWVSSTAVLAL